MRNPFHMPAVDIVDGFNRTSSLNPCLVKLYQYTDLREIVLSGGNRAGGIIVFCRNRETSWISHLVADNRESIFKAESLSQFEDTLIGNCILYGELSFKEDGDKLTAYFPVEGKPPIRISTDLQVIEYIVDKHHRNLYFPLIWYRDP